MNQKSPRKWQCFVCGQNHQDYDTYKKHIMDEHDQGREFIMCPACDAPVRDMRTHYAAKHPNRIMPKDGQMRVAIWNDFKDGKKKTRKPTFKEGYFISEKNGGAELHYRSGYEAEVYELLEQDCDVASFLVEPFKVPYFFEDRPGHGKWYDYVPDLRVNFTDGSTDIWEIKPASQTDLEKNKAKWAAMKVYAENLGWRFTVITEIGINKLKMKIKQQRLVEG